MNPRKQALLDSPDAVIRLLDHQSDLFQTAQNEPAEDIVHA
jgi:hypothetical protein